MSEEKTNNIEIDLGQFFKSIIKGFKSLLKLLIKALLFYKKKWVLFSILFVAGAIGGYFLEKAFALNKRHKQEIILEPKYDTTSYIYEFVDNLNIKFKDKLFLKEIDLDSTDIKYLKKITLEPIIQSKDVLDELQRTYKGQNFFNQFMDGYEDEALNSEKYKSFFKNHKLTLIFKGGNENNAKVSKQLLGFISSNEYYNKELSLTLKQTKSNLEKNKETLVFVEEYLKKLSKKPFNQNKEIIVVGGDSEIPTIASLLDRKESLMRIISFQEKLLELDTKLFDIIEYGNVVRHPVGIHKRIIVLLPVLLCFFVSIIFLFKNSTGKLENFINN
ncbi:hypothetical protein [uncultured Aquimarina sp.]|uniref:hypothetical protein n=1 Tax=uncultured Aquimarina sp. TaxID=575652 RepID=UPI0026255CA9|nr:hypothetical protein [uncultured Aquimarina sp.]